MKFCITHADRFTSGLIAEQVLASSINYIGAEIAAKMHEDIVKFAPDGISDDLQEQFAQKIPLETNA